MLLFWRLVFVVIHLWNVLRFRELRFLLWRLFFRLYFIFLLLYIFLFQFLLSFVTCRRLFRNFFHLQIDFRSVDLTLLDLGVQNLLHIHQISLVYSVLLLEPFFIGLTLGFIDSFLSWIDVLPAMANLLHNIEHLHVRVLVCHSLSHLSDKDHVR